MTAFPIVIPAKAGIHVVRVLIDIRRIAETWAPACAGRRVMGGWIYIMTNRAFGTLYIGVTSNLARRVHEHRSGEGSAFCRKHRLRTLVYAEPHATIEEAIRREKAMKAWKRNWKLRLIVEANPDWTDLYRTINA